LDVDVAVSVDLGNSAKAAHQDRAVAVLTHDANRFTNRSNEITVCHLLVLL
jgi:hypothetical protein